ncbi:MAG TPA: toxin [Prolixibacteraceae bacterium]|nr:toxin [Prolixibacteraceae bacterium]
MATKQEVERFLNDFKTKMSIFHILFMDYRGKNAQALLDLEISPIKRIEILKKLTVEDYSEGPLAERMRDILPMWVFGKEVKGTEVYIKISMGAANSQTICISFHPAEHPMKYPNKQTKQ